MSFEVCKAKWMQGKPVVDATTVEAVGEMDLNFDGKAEERYQIMSNTKTFCGDIPDEVMIKELVGLMGAYRNLVAEPGKPTQVIGGFWRATLSHNENTTAVSIEKPLPMVDADFVKAFKAPLANNGEKVGIGDFVLTKDNQVFVVIDFNIINGMKLGDKEITFDPAGIKATIISEAGFKKLKEQKKPSEEDVRNVLVSELRPDPLGPMRKK